MIFEAIWALLAPEGEYKRRRGACERLWQSYELGRQEAIYAYIYGLSHGEKHGYDVSKRHLAELLRLPKSTAFDALDTLTEKHLIVCTDGIWLSVRPAPESVRPTDENGRSADSPPHTPI